jgi:tetratricopeptide (TPR) repeat protein
MPEMADVWFRAGKVPRNFSVKIRLTPDKVTDRLVNRRNFLAVAVASLLVLLVFELALSVWPQTQTFDEADHILAGYRYWQCSDFGINPEHPPMAKLLATLPLLFHTPQVPVGPCGVSDTGPEADFANARKFLYANDADAILFQARLAAATLTLLLAVLVFEAANKLFGSGPALLALTLFVFEPNVLAHGALVTTDMAVTCCLFAAVYAFYRYAQQPSALRLLEAGFVTGLVLTAKFSGGVVVPILALLAYDASRTAPAGSATLGPAAATFRKGFHRVRVLSPGFAVILALAVVVIWASYGFRYAARPAGRAMPPFTSERIQSEGARDGRRSPFLKVIPAMASLRLLPESYLRGLEKGIGRSAAGRPTFLLGKRYPRGQWFYFPVAFSIKSTLGFLALLLMALAARWLYREEYRREFLFMSIPPAVFLAVSLTSGVNIGLRHILPVYPFLIVLAAAGAWRLAQGRRLWACAVALLLAAHCLSSLRTFPHYLAYSNEAWGGPARTYRLLSDSNVDWGQDLKAAIGYLHRQGISDCWSNYAGADPDYYHFPCKHLPGAFGTPPVDEVPVSLRSTLLVGATEISGQYWEPGDLNPYQAFQGIEPVANIGGSMLVFQGEFDLKLASGMSHWARSWGFAANQQFEQAVSEARAAVALVPRSARAHYTLGHILAQTGQTAEARRELQAALSLTQLSPPGYYSSLLPSIQKDLAEN